MAALYIITNDIETQRHILQTLQSLDYFSLKKRIDLVYLVRV